MESFARQSLAQFTIIYGEIYAGTAIEPSVLETMMWERMCAKEKEAHVTKLGFKVPYDNIRRAKVTLPYMPECINYTGCPVIKKNGGLYTPCCGKVTDGDYCKSCSVDKEGNEKKIEFGVVDERESNVEDGNFAPITYAEWMRGHKTSLSELYAKLAAAGVAIEIPPAELTCREVPKRRKGRPAKSDDSVVDEDSVPKTEKPKKAKKAESDSEAEKPKKKAKADSESDKPKKKAKKADSDEEAEKPKKKPKADSDEEKPKKKAAKKADSDSEEPEVKPKKKAAKKADSESETENPKAKAKKPKAKADDSESETENPKAKAKKPKAKAGSDSEPEVKPVKAKKPDEKPKKADKKPKKKPADSDSESEDDTPIKKSPHASPASSDTEKGKKAKATEAKPNAWSEAEAADQDGFEEEELDDQEIEIDGKDYTLRNGKFICNDEGTILGSMDDEGCAVWTSDAR